MATFLTHTPLSKMTAGERRFYDLVNNYLDDSYHIWFNLPLQGNTRRYPDYLIFHPKHGLLSIEIKDWSMKALKGLQGDHQLLLDFGDGVTTQENPLEQARNSLFPLINKMKSDPKLLQESGTYQGKLVIPWGFGAVMTNWEYHKITDKAKAALETLFPRKTTFYKEDILDGGLNQDEFIHKLHGLFPYQFNYPLSFEQATRIRAHIFPEFIVGCDQQIFADAQDPIDVIIPNQVQIMDNRQEQAARRLGAGHRVFHGVAGSGKTLLLIHRARKLAQQHPDKPILVLCYNKTLAAWLKNQLPQAEIETYHYHGWCKAMKEQYGIHITYGDGYFDRLAENISYAAQTGDIPHGQYSAVLIDEGHDFAEDWLRAAVCQAEGDSGQTQSLLLLYDDAQSIYDNRKADKNLGFSLSSVNIAAAGRTVIFKKNYRNSAEILQYAAAFLNQYLVAHSADENSIPLINPESAGIKAGIAPFFQQCSTQNEENRVILQYIQQWRQQNQLPLGEIAVLCYSKARGSKIITYLQEHGIPVQNLIDSKNRSNYQYDSRKITVCTMHSSKGLEFQCVIVSQIESLNSQESECEKSARLLYVAMTRAKTQLILTAANHNKFTEQLSNLNSRNDT